MNPIKDEPTRRQLMATMTGLPLMGAVQAYGAAPARIGRHDKPVLVAYLSRSGNTRVVAGLLSRSLGADLFEILPLTPYPEDYLATVEQARKERDQGIQPALKGSVPNMSAYATIFLGMPIWGETAPPLIRSFLSAHDLSGKTLIPFVTHGGYGLGSSQSVIARHAPRARLQAAFVMQADQERQTMERVHTWLGSLPAKPA